MVVAADMTNSLMVFYPNYTSAPASFEELASYGDIASLEVSPDAPNALVVSYYDIRVAASAAAALGNRCQWAPQFGNRTVPVEGQFSLDEWMLREVAFVRQTDQDADTYTLEFYDTRSAIQAEKKLQKQSHRCQQQDVADMLPVAAPRYRNDLRLSEVNWRDLADGRDMRTTLRLRCLPSFLCKEESLERVLATAGLDQVVDCMRVFPAQRGQRAPGSALVNAVDSEGACAIARFFHGRRWGSSMPVAVSFAAVQGRCEVDEKFPKDALRNDLAFRGGKEPWRIEAVCAQPVGDLGASEVSTEAGDDGETVGVSSIGKEVPAKIIDYPAVHMIVHA